MEDKKTRGKEDTNMNTGEQRQGIRKQEERRMRRKNRGIRRQEDWRTDREIRRQEERRIGREDRRIRRQEDWMIQTGEKENKR